MLSQSLTLRHTKPYHHASITRLEYDQNNLEITMSISENKQRMARGELYHAFTPELTAQRQRSKWACARYNRAGEVSRRRLCELFREYV